MTYRPYPNADRALRQLARGCGVKPPTGPDLAAAVRGVQPSGREFGRALSQAFAAPGDYVLSTRRSGEDGHVVTLSSGSVSPEVAARFPPEFIERVNQPHRPGVVGGRA